MGGPAQPQLGCPHLRRPAAGRPGPARAAPDGNRALRTCGLTVAAAATVPEIPPVWHAMAYRLVRGPIMPVCPPRVRGAIGPVGPPGVPAMGAMEMPRSGTPRLVPDWSWRMIQARSRRMIQKPPGPGLRPEMPCRRITVRHDLRRVVHDDREAERGEGMGLTRTVAVRRGRRRDHGHGTESRGQQQHHTHRLPPCLVASMR